MDMRILNPDECNILCFYQDIYASSKKSNKAYKLPVLVEFQDAYNDVSLRIYSGQIFYRPFL